jgi:hypothetical protein
MMQAGGFEREEVGEDHKEPLELGDQGDPAQSGYGTSSNAKAVKISKGQLIKNITTTSFFELSFKVPLMIILLLFSRSSHSAHPGEACDKTEDHGQRPSLHHGHQGQQRRSGKSHPEDLLPAGVSTLTPWPSPSSEHCVRNQYVTTTTLPLRSSRLRVEQGTPPEVTEAEGHNRFLEEAEEDSLAMDAMDARAELGDLAKAYTQNAKETQGLRLGDAQQAGYGKTKTPTKKPTKKPKGAKPAVANPAAASYYTVVDTPGWKTKSGGKNCADYKARCAGGAVKAGEEGSLGSKHNYPERNCVVCGKGPLFCDTKEPLKMNAWSEVSITLTAGMMTVRVNGITQCSHGYTTFDPGRKNVKVYQGDPWSTPADAFIKARAPPPPPPLTFTWPWRT